MDKIIKALENVDDNQKIQRLVKEHKEQIRTEGEYIHATKKDIDTTLYNGRNTYRKLKKKKQLKI